MSTLEFPKINEDLARPVAVVAEPKQATLKETALASFAPIVAHMAVLAQRYRNVAFDLTTPKGMSAAKAARLELREDGRYAVQRLQKRLKDEANDLKRTIDAKAAEAIAIVQPVEDAIHAQIEAREQEIEAERERVRQAEAARKAAHEAGMADIRSFLAHARGPGMTAARIAAGMDILRGMTFGPQWEEYAVPAANAQCETLQAMAVLHEAALAREAEAARLEAQRIENERVAAELAERQRQLDAQAAALRLQEEAAAAARQAEQERQAEQARAEREQIEAAERREQERVAQAGQARIEREASAPVAPPTQDAGAAPQPAANPAVLPDSVTPLDAGDREAQPAAASVEPIEADEVVEVLLAKCLALTGYLELAFVGRWPAHPKPEQGWWTGLRERIDGVRPGLIAITSKGA